MFLELIATFAAGAGAAGIVMLINLATRGRLPRWAMPVAAGMVMLGYTVWSEYSWAGRTIAGLPQGVEVLDTTAESKWWKPWTFAIPQVTRLMAVDTASIRTNQAAPGTRMVDLYLFQRWTPPATVAQLVDCESAARADVTPAALAAPASADWLNVGRDDPLVASTCKGDA